MTSDNWDANLPDLQRGGPQSGGAPDFPNKCKERGGNPPHKTGIKKDKETEGRL